MSQSAAPEARSRTVDIATAKGVVHIRTHCTPDFVDSLKLDEGLGMFPHYRSIVRDKKSMENIAGLRRANLVLAYDDEGKIVGYIAFADPSPLERWGESGDGLLYELGSIEVSRNWRRFGIAKEMVEIAMDDEELEDRIVFLTGFCWHWDLEGTSLSKADYRRMLMHIFEPFGFRHFYTTEPNINLDIANMFMARIGSRVSLEDQERFLDLLFAGDHGWGVF